MFDRSHDNQCYSAIICYCHGFHTTSNLHPLMVIRVTFLLDLYNYIVIEPIFTKLPSYQVTKSPSYQVTKSPSYQVTKLPSYQVTKSPSYQVTKLPSNEPCLVPLREGEDLLLKKMMKMKEKQLKHVSHKHSTILPILLIQPTSAHNPTMVNK